MCSIRTLLSHDGQQVGDAHTHHDCICRYPVKEAAVGSITECLQRPYTNDPGPRVPPWEVEQPSKMLSFSLLPSSLNPSLLPPLPPLSLPFLLPLYSVLSLFLRVCSWGDYGTPDLFSFLFFLLDTMQFVLLHTPPPHTISNPYPHYRRKKVPQGILPPILKFIQGMVT